MTLEQLIHLMTRLCQYFSYSPQLDFELQEKLTQLIQNVGTMKKPTTYLFRIYGNTLHQTV